MSDEAVEAVMQQIANVLTNLGQTPQSDVLNAVALADIDRIVTRAGYQIRRSSDE